MYIEVDSFCLIIHIYSCYFLISPIYIFLLIACIIHFIAAVSVTLIKHLMLF